MSTTATVSTVDDLFLAVANPKIQIICLNAGIYRLTRPLIIARSNLTIFGGNAKLVIESNINYPVIHIGSTKLRKPSTSTINGIVRNVTLHNLFVDGNKTNAVENSDFGYWIKNNAISIRFAQNISLVDCHANNSRSGGIVAAMSQDIFIKNCQSDQNAYDGVAPYRCTNVMIFGCGLNGNVYSGLSIEQCRQVYVCGCRFANNADWCVFMRRSTDIFVVNNTMSSSENRSIFSSKSKFSEVSLK